MNAFSRPTASIINESADTTAAAFWHAAKILTLYRRRLKTNLNVFVEIIPMNCGQHDRLFRDWLLADYNIFIQTRRFSWRFEFKLNEIDILDDRKHFTLEILRMLLWEEDKNCFSLTHVRNKHDNESFVNPVTSQWTLVLNIASTNNSFLLIFYSPPQKQTRLIHTFRAERKQEKSPEYTAQQKFMFRRRS